MPNNLLYCFRNPIGQLADEIQLEAEGRDLQLNLVPSYCMKLCMFCSQRLVCVVNRDLVVAKDLSELVNQIQEKLDMD